eukprot:m.934317 g.934317  ORF g.934317 m.934317 type:complete len:198 (-) comp205767_c0_seq1:507-1100(-)
MKKSFHAFTARMSGLTLVEILTGVAVLSILMAIAAPSMADLLEKRRVIAATDEIAGILAYAKAETNSTNSKLIVQFDVDPNLNRTMSCAAVVTASSWNQCKCWQPANNVCPAGSSRLLRLFQLPLQHVRFASAGTFVYPFDNQIMFDRDQATISVEGFHVDVVGQRKGYALRVEVNTAGRVKICSPNGDMSGYATCV